MRNQLHIVVEVDEGDEDKVPTTLFQTVRSMVEEADVPNAHVFWYQQEEDA